MIKVEDILREIAGFLTKIHGVDVLNCQFADGVATIEVAVDNIDLALLVQDLSTSANVASKPPIKPWKLDKEV